MAVDDVGAFDRKSEFLEDFITEFLFFAQFIIRVHVFLRGCLVSDKVVLEGRHIVLSVYRGLRSTP